MSRWQVQYSADAVRWLRKADPQIARRVRDAMTAIATLDDPRQRGKGLTSSLSGLWRYRVGDIRIICDIYDNELTILTVTIGHRSNVYN